MDSQIKYLNGENVQNKPSIESVSKEKNSRNSLGNCERLYPSYDETLWLRSCEKEVPEPLIGEIKGNVPTWLTGSLLRNGPGILKYGESEFKHLFDASALLHKFDIKDGKITYQCKFLQSEAYRKNSKHNRIVVNEFGTTAVPDPCLSIFRRFAAIFQPEMSDNANVSVYPFGDEIYAFSESRILHKINIEDLSTDGNINLSDHVAIFHNTSHPHVEKNGDVYNLGEIKISRKPHHVIICHPIAESGEEMFKKSHIVASIPARWPLHPSYMHSFGITDNYFIIVEQPMVISVPKMVLGTIIGNSISGSVDWFPGEYTKINILSRQTGELYRSFQAEAFCYFHIIHQFEEDDHVIVDICTYEDGSVLNNVYLESIKTMQSNPDYGKSMRARPDRFVLPLNPETKNENVNLVKLKGTKAEAYYISNGGIFVIPERICDIGCELARINYDYLGKPYRYFYAIDSDVDVKSPGGLIKVDTHKKEYKFWWEEHCYLSEPIFIPKPDAKKEDDGVVLSAMIWENDPNLVGLLILDAENFEEICRAIFRTPVSIPKSFHGWFVPYKN